MDEKLSRSAARESIVGGLPAPGADEPAGLRQDIADEIADHLLCAARREQLQNRTNGPLTDQAALSAAIERFGEPAAVARRLWWDAMKERIMAQRILMLMAMTLAAAAVFACIVLWQSTQTSRAEQAALMESQREVMTAMLAELKSSQKADGAQWQTLRFRLVDEQGSPVAGMVSCGGKDGIGDNVHAGANGVAEFYLPPGSYSTTILVDGESTVASVLMPPGRPTERKIVCPRREVQRAPLVFEVAAPIDLPIYYIAEIRLMSRQVGDHSWFPNPIVNGLRLLLNPQGKVLGQLTNVPVRAASVGSSVSSPNATTFPNLLPVGASLTTPEGFPAGSYLVNLAPYVPTDPAAAANDAKAIPTLRCVWGAGACTQFMVDTQAKDFKSVLIDEAVLNWKRLIDQIAATPGDPSYPAGAPLDPYAATPNQYNYATPPAPANPSSPYTAEPGYASPQAPSVVPPPPQPLTPSVVPHQPPLGGPGTAPPAGSPAVGPPSIPPSEESRPQKPRLIPLAPVNEPTRS